MLPKGGPVRCDRSFHVLTAPPMRLVGCLLLQSAAGCMKAGKAQPVHHTALRALCCRGPRLTGCMDNVISDCHCVAKVNGRGHFMATGQPPPDTSNCLLRTKKPSSNAETSFHHSVLAKIGSPRLPRLPPPSTQVIHVLSCGCIGLIEQSPTAIPYFGIQLPPRRSTDYLGAQNA